MLGRTHIPRDPFEGSGAHRKRLRLRVEGAMALSLAIAACGITAAVWFRTLAPLVESILTR
jgi:fructose-1,6-bisphosphatase/inositol monophosphatase family enzyme